MIKLHWILKFALTFSAAIFVAAIANDSHADDYDVYILTGQSNSLGTTGLEGGSPNYEPGSNPADTNTRFFWSNASSTGTVYPANLHGNSGGVITTLQMQQGDGGANPHFWGPEFGFARQMANNTNGRKILVIKASRGGGGNSLWDKTVFDGNNNNGHMWGHLRDTVDAGLNSLAATDTFSVKGLIYMQGESNNASEAPLAGSRLQSLAANLETHINATSYSSSGSAAGMYSVTAEIAASSANVNRILTTTQQRDLGRSNSQFGFVTTSDQPLKSDNLHFGRDAKLTYGSRIADAFNSQAFTEGVNYIAGYSANANPGSAIPDPAGQGLALAGNIANVTTEAINDGGNRAWRLFDNSTASNPGYSQALRAADFDRMFESGWKFTAVAKVASGGGLALWSTTQANDPGWNLDDVRNLNGFVLNRVNGDQLEVTLWQNQSTINLGAGSADSFHRFELIGAAGSSLFDFYVDGQLRLAGVDLRNGNGLAGFDNQLIFNSGSTGGIGRDVYWSEVSLTAVPEPGSSVVLGIIGVVFMAFHRNRHQHN